MPKDGSVTRARLVEEGLRLFADDGVDGAQLREIVRAAGQANDSAVHYHFGSRAGLLLAVCTWQITLMEPARRARAAAQDGPADLTRAVTDLVEPTANLLRSVAGRQFLRLIAQLAGQAGVRTDTIPAAMAGTALLDQLQTVQRHCAQALPRPVARERVAFMIGALTASLADRARTIDADTRPQLSHRAYVQNLITMLVAGLAVTPG